MIDRRFDPGERFALVFAIVMVTANVIAWTLILL